MEEFVDDVQSVNVGIQLALFVVCVLLTIIGILGALDVWGWSPLIDMPNRIPGFKVDWGADPTGPGLLFRGWPVYWLCLAAGPVVVLGVLGAWGLIGDDIGKRLLAYYIYACGLFFFSPILVVFGLAFLEIALMFFKGFLEEPVELMGLIIPITILILGYKWLT